MTTHANVHRGVYAIAEEATRLYEEARRTVGRFIGAPTRAPDRLRQERHRGDQPRRQLVWPAPTSLRDAVVVTEMEHHANLVPWLMVTEERGIELRHIGLDGPLHPRPVDLDSLVDGAGLVAVSAMSNVLGTLNDLRPIVEAAHRAGALVLCDASQLVPHRRIDVASMGVDFLAFTGHKMLGPTGIGVLWARQELLEEMPPFLGGGEMISDVRLDGFTTNEVPWKFEAGTPPIAEAIGLGAAIGYLESVGMERIAAHEEALTDLLSRRLCERHGDDVDLRATSRRRAAGGAISIGYRDIHPHDLAQVLDAEGVCVRAGHHCAKPLMRRLGVSATARASLYLYNDEEDVTLLSTL